MTQTVELLLDAASEAGLVRDWGLLDEAGLASQAQHRGETNRPHVTLAAGSAIRDGGEEALARLCARRLPVPTMLGGYAVFGAGPVVLVRLVVVTPALLALHAAVVEQVMLSERSLTAVGRWTPHLTLARRMPLAQLEAALTTLGRAQALPASLEGARRWDGVARRAWPLL